MSSGNFDLLEIIFGLVGGLAIFIYGMNLMSDGLRKAAGEKMRRVIEALTSNPILGVLVGAIVTALMQSSSATTVMVVGFVSARLMTLPQAISVILGANIGTTITAQLIAFKIGHYAYPIAALGFIFFFFFKKKIFKYFGQTVFAFGLLFIGLNTMGDVMKPLAQNPVFANAILKLGNNPVLGLIVGTVMTVCIQSSSATIGILQNLASQPIADGSTQSLISLNIAMPVLFGNNIGTTITAIFAAIGAKVNAKRAALAHSIFNLAGALIFVWLIPLFAKFVEFISPKGAQIDIIARQIANAHTAFNVLNTLIWLPFIWLLSKIVTFLIKGEEDFVEKRVLYLDKRVLNNPAIAMEFATKELTRMAKLAKHMMNSANKAFVLADMDEAKKVHELEETVDMLQYEIINYLSTMLSQSTLTERQSIRLAGLMHVASDVERIGDHCENIANFAQMKENEQLPFSKEALEEISNAFDKLNKTVENSITALHDGNVPLAKEVIKEEAEIDTLEADLRHMHIKRLNKGLCFPHSGVTFVELIHNIEKIADHCKNIAEAVINDYGSKSKPE